MPQPRNLPSLPFHLTLQGMLFAASNAALQQARLASQSSNANWPNFAGMPNLSGMLPFQVDEAALEQAVNHELKARSQSLLEGIHHYLKHPYSRPEPAAETIAQLGGSRLLDYTVENEKAAVFFVPSLINRHYILDLMEGRSLIGHLREQGIRSFVVDWGDPADAERDFTLADYIERLSNALEIVQKRTKKPLILAGYCMGGLLALALAQKHEAAFSGLALLATPWDFHAKGFPRVPLDLAHRESLENLLSRQPILSGDIIQTLFYTANPWVFARKFAAFSGLAEEDSREFVAIESWVNDNVDMTAPVARECLIGWVQENRPVRGAWQVKGEPILPDGLSLPVFAACPTQDTIVPPRSAEAILAAFPEATVCRPISGHVGMVAGPRAHKELWQPFRMWVESLISA
ncbi:MAG: alpha/beta hydrolase [Alphaproteobacteria bacterium]|nr:alpha/beta hydrolase [Alphaproteobacteria bacterium]